MKAWIFFTILTCTVFWIFAQVWWKMTDSSHSFYESRLRHYTTPRLIVGKGTVSQVSCAKLLGDIIINDKVKNAKAVMVNSLASCSELTMGVHLMGATLVMSGSVFLATLLFNSQGWTNLTKTDIKRLKLLRFSISKRLLTPHCQSLIRLLFLSLVFFLHPI